jgi:hypothetical protein
LDGSVLKRLFVIVAVGLVAGGLAVVILSALYSNSRAVHNIMSPAAFGVTSVVIFFLAFGITVLVLALTFVSRDEWAELLASGNEAAAKEAKGRSRSKAGDGVRLAVKEEDKTSPLVSEQMRLGTATAAAANPGAVPTPAPKPTQTWTGARRDEPQDLSARPAPYQAPAPAAMPKLEPMDVAKNEAAKLLELSIAALPGFGLKVDDRTRLGCALYLAGAAEAVAEKHKLKEGEALSVIESCIDLLNGGPPFAEAFAKDYLQHLKNKDNAAIFGAGRGAIMTATGAPQAPATDGQPSIDLGDLGQPSAEGASMPAAKFDAPPPTGDILAQPEPPPAPPVPSLPGLAMALDVWLGDDPTSSAQAGEAVLIAEMETPPKPEAQDTTSLNRIEVSRRVMRRALRTTGGIAIKQSWGGIVASFPQSADAILAAAEMMRGASEHTALYPLESVVLKIGVATDRVGAKDRTIPPAAELASRFLRHAKSGEIIADRITCMAGGELGKAAKDRGTLALAGVAKPIQIATVEWRNRFPTGKAQGAPGQAGASQTPQTQQQASGNGGTIRALASQSFHGPAHGRPAPGASSSSTPGLKK